MIQNNSKGGIIGSIIGITTLALLGIVIYFALKGFIWFIFFFAWIFLLVAAILDYKVIINFGKRLLNLLKRKPLYGIGAVILSGVLYPFLFFILMMRAVLSKFVKKVNFDIPGFDFQQQSQKEEFVDYEEVEEEHLELKEIELRKRNKNS
jgi:hypothetical protein